MPAAATFRTYKDPLSEPNPFKLPEQTDALFRMRDEAVAAEKTVGFFFFFLRSERRWFSPDQDFHNRTLSLFHAWRVSPGKILAEDHVAARSSKNVPAPTYSPLGWQQ